MMREINIPFLPEFKKVLLSGQKTCTARTKKYGSEGDRFAKFGAIFELTNVEVVPLSKVADMWEEEGCESREHFKQIWCKIHPKRGYQPNWLVWLHEFKRVDWYE